MIELSTSVWQPKRTSTLVYRSQFTSHAADLRDQAVEQFTQWLRGKEVVATPSALMAGAAVEATDGDGTRRVASGASGTWGEPNAGRRLHALRLRLEENLVDGGAWITTLTVAVPSVTEQEVLLPASTVEPAQLFDLAGWPEQAWVWLDLEHHPAPDSPPMRPGSPRLVRDLLAAVEGTDGPLPLTSDVLDITESHVGELGSWLFDSRRRVPVIVFTPDPEYAEPQQRFAKTLARDVTGVAVVVRLVDADAAAAFTRHVGTHLHVFGGGMRTYLPGLQRMEPFPKRHRVLSAATMRAIGRRSANAVRDQVLGLSTRRTPPTSNPLVQRALARNLVERNLGERRRALRPSIAPPIQPELFPARAETPTIPGIDEAVGLSTSAIATSATQEANEVLRAMLAFASVDASSIPRTTTESCDADVDAERQGLERLLERVLQAASEPTGVEPDLTAKISTLEEENTLLFAEVDVLQGQLAEYQQSSAEVEKLRFDREFAELELIDAERTAEHLHARIRWLESELTTAGAPLRSPTRGSAYTGSTYRWPTLHAPWNAHSFDMSQHC